MSDTLSSFVWAGITLNIIIIIFLTNLFLAFSLDLFVSKKEISNYRVASNFASLGLFSKTQPKISSLADSKTQIYYFATDRDLSLRVILFHIFWKTIPLFYYYNFIFFSIDIFSHQVGQNLRFALNDTDINCIKF